MQKILLTIFLLALFSLRDHAQENLTKYVNPFIGTGGHGHTYPGAVVPHGMVQLSPDTRLQGWDGCSGYHYSDNYIYGFTHTHLSGTGVNDYGDILLMPNVGHRTANNKIYGSKFQHKNEKASPGYYSVMLDDENILAELTATSRVGLHRYTFPATDKAEIILDLKHRDAVLENSINIEDSVTISGMRRSKAWAQDQHIYFVLKFSKPFTANGIYLDDTETSGIKSFSSTKQTIKAYFEFNTHIKETVLAKVGISSVSIEGARKNLEAELPGWDFDKVRADAETAWNTELSKIEVSGGTPSQMNIFYAALYHTMIVPNINMDVDKQYRGRDNKIHIADDFTNYTVFSLWDTYRAAHPLYTIIDQARTLDYIKTFLVQYQQGGRLPVWELSNNETDCMIGYHSVPVIVDAAAKGIDQFDKKLALAAMEKSSTWNHYGLPALMDHGYIASEDENESVSKTLEYAYDDWCIAQFAKITNNKSDYETYIKRAQSYKNLLDVQSGFMRPRKNGNWLSPFDPREVNNNFTEANSWQYSFYVPQDISGYMSLLGGRQRLERKLDSLFNQSSKTTGRDQSDITGLIGQYAHGNEPSHHIIYLYNFAGKAYKTQEKVYQVMNEMYHDAPDGLAGNEDCGQMSAWYVLSALGFYPVTPGTTEYVIGTPLFSKAIIHLENGKSFEIKKELPSQLSPLWGEAERGYYYIHSATLNSNAHIKSYFTHDDIMKGGNITFMMGNKSSIFGNDNYPSTSINENKIVINPVIDGGNFSFIGNKSIKIYCTEAGVKIYYTTNGESPEPGESLAYSKPFNISSDATVKAIAVNETGEQSKITTAKFHHRTNNWTIKTLTPYEPEYSSGGEYALIDEIRGTTNWRAGNWQGFQKNDVDVTIDLKKVTSISNVTADFLQDTGAWIIMPKQVSVEVSNDGESFKEVYNGEKFLPIEDLKVQTQQIVAKFNPVKVRYVKLKAIQYGKLPAWHEGAGNNTHIFIDEISIK